MSLDTILQIGKALRNSENNLKYFRYVEPCPKDKKGNWPICITIPVKDDFSFDWDNLDFTPEKQKESLYYLKFKTSDSDTSANKYLFGDIYYSRKTDVNNNGEIKKINSFGNYTLEKNNAFDNGIKAYHEIANHFQDACHSLISFHDMFEKDIKIFNLILLYASACESIIINEPENMKEYLTDEDKMKTKYIQTVFENEEISKLKHFLQKGETIGSLTNETKNKILHYANFSVFIHFEFYDEKISWYQIEDAFTILKEKLNTGITHKTKEGIVPSKSIYRTLCSGNDRNDIQFPEFDIDKAYKSFVFQSYEKFDDFLYTDKILNKPLHRLYEIKKEKIDMFVFPVAMRGEQINVKEYDSFFFKTKNEHVLEGKTDPLFSILEDESVKRFNRFDFILSDSGGKTTDDLIEVSGIERSMLKSISEEIQGKAIEIEIERRSLFDKNEKLPSIKIETSLINILGTYIINKSNYLEVTKNRRYKLHILKILPLIYTKNYYIDDTLLSIFINNMENIVRLVKEKVSRYKYNLIKYDLKFLLSIQNTKNNRYMEIIDSKSYLIGIDLGRLAKPLRKTINSFEKKYVGLLTRHISTKDDCIKFVNTINEMLVRHEKLWGKLASETIGKLVEIPQNEYDKEKIALGFFEGYLKYEASDEKTQFISKIEKIISDYDERDNLQSEIQIFKNALDEIK